jgi:hypothetical protein
VFSEPEGVEAALLRCTRELGDERRQISDITERGTAAEEHGVTLNLIRKKLNLR